MTLAPDLMAVLACPEDHGSLYLLDADVAGVDAGPTGESLYNPRLARRYAVRDGIPVMLLDEAEAVDDDCASRLAALIASGAVSATGAGAG